MVGPTATNVKSLLLTHCQKENNFLWHERIICAKSNPKPFFPRHRHRHRRSNDDIPRNFEFSTWMMRACSLILNTHHMFVLFVLFFFLWKSLTWKKRPLLTIILFNFFFLLCLFVCLSFSVFFFSVLLFTNFTLLLAYCPIYRSNVVVVVGKFNWDFFFFVCKSFSYSIPYLMHAKLRLSKQHFNRDILNIDLKLEYIEFKINVLHTYTWILHNRCTRVTQGRQQRLHFF